MFLSFQRNFVKWLHMFRCWWIFLRPWIFISTKLVLCKREGTSCLCRSRNCWRSRHETIWSKWFFLHSYTYCIIILMIFLHDLWIWLTNEAFLSGLADPYVKGQLGPYRFRTKIQRKTLSPQWREEFKIPIITWESENVLAIEVRDKDTFVDDVLGFVFKFITSMITSRKGYSVCCKFWSCDHSLLLIIQSNILFAEIVLSA